MSDDDQERCPCCGSRRVAARTRSFRLVLLPAFVCGDCGAEWRPAWRPYLATAGLYGGVLVALVAAGSGLWTFLAADSETIDGRTWGPVGIAAAIAVGAGGAAKRAWTFLRRGPDWVVVERKGGVAGPAQDRSELRAAAAPTTTSERPRRSAWFEGAVVFGFLALAAIFGTERPQERLEREKRALPRGPSPKVIRSIPMGPYVGSSSEPKTLGQEADAVGESFSEEILRKLEAWKEEEPRRESASPYLDDILRLPSTSKLEESDTADTAVRDATRTPAFEHRDISPDLSSPLSPKDLAPDVTTPASAPKE